MTITKKPKLAETKVSGSQLPESAVHALIEKGGSVAKREVGEKRPEHKPQFIQLRLDRDFLTKIDAVLHKRKVKTPRHTWILEALYEKLEREGGDIG